MLELFAKDNERIKTTSKELGNRGYKRNLEELFTEDWTDIQL